MLVSYDTWGKPTAVLSEADSSSVWDNQTIVDMAEGQPWGRRHMGSRIMQVGHQMLPTTMPSCNSSSGTWIRGWGGLCIAAAAILPHAALGIATTLSLVRTADDSVPACLHVEVR